MLNKILKLYRLECTYQNSLAAEKFYGHVQCSSDMSEPKYTRNARQPNTRIRVCIYARARMYIRTYAYTVYSCFEKGCHTYEENLNATMSKVIMGNGCFMVE